MYKDAKPVNKAISSKMENACPVQISLRIVPYVVMKILAQNALLPRSF